MATFTITVEIAFNANFTTAAASRTWTDVSTYVRYEPGIEITAWGRTGALQTTEPAELSLTLKNGDGRFTPGNTSSPYYPNVKLDRPIRVTVTPDGGSASVRFLGYVNEWPTVWPAIVDTYAEATITATSRTGRLGLKNAMRSMGVEEALSTSAVAIYPLTDPSGSTQAEDLSGNDAAPLATASAGNGAELSFTSSGVEFAGGKYLVGGAAINTGTTPNFTMAASFISTSSVSGRVFSTFGRYNAEETAPYVDGVPHRLVVVRESDGTITRYVDGAVAATNADTSTTQYPITVGNGFVGTVRDFAIWHSALDVTAVTDDYTAFNGGYGELSDATFERIAGYLGIPLAEVNADAGVVVMGGIDTSGMAGTDALRVVESTEGGTMIDARNGDLRLIGRRARYHSASAVTLDVSAGEIAPGYVPSLNRGLLRNDVTGTNAASSVGSVDSGATVSKNATNAASVAEYGTAAGSVEVAAASEAEPYAAASWIVANFGEPRSRVPSLNINMANLSAAKRALVLSMFSGDRLTVTNRPSQDSTSEANFFLEGGSERWWPHLGILEWNVSPVGLEDSVLIIDDAVLGQIDADNYIGY